MKTALIVVDAQRINTDKKSDLFCKDSAATIVIAGTYFGRSL
jgi:hypothetical protein